MKHRSSAKAMKKTAAKSAKKAMNRSSAKTKRAPSGNLAASVDIPYPPARLYRKADSRRGPRLLPGLQTRMSAPGRLFSKSVFISCPFDDQYTAMFEAAVFAVMECGFTPRCALEIIDAGEIRIDKINRIIAICKFGIHDISRTEFDSRPPSPKIQHAA